MNKLVIGVLLIIVLASVFAPFLTPHDPDEINLDELRESPSLKHPFGTDSKGRDILSRVLYGGRVSLSVAAVAALVSLCVGLVIGLLSGYLGGTFDTAVMMLVDFILAFPSLLLAIGISVILPPGIYTVMIVIAAVGWASFARLIRGHVLSLRNAPFIEAAKAIGCSNTRILLVHLFPQCIPLGIVVTGLKLGGYILTEASLSFLGLGVQPPAPSWGSMISTNRVFIISAPWMVIFPGLAITATSLCCNMLGDALNARYGFRMRGRSMSP
ncbi:MAG TPA: peptide ABC transporter permease [Nitrospiraceae bacterium]|jgi:ABC-type dipeptide/oligopeptide/nickel transport system permease subunit|nr:peptide ABC transporter permease [Nitrospiraceae bacterium]